MVIDYYADVRPTDWLGADRIGLDDWCRPKGKPTDQVKFELIDEIVAKAIANVESVSIEERFREQADKWAHETRHLSSPTQRAGHPSYQAILGMGQENKEEVVRLLLRDLQQNRRPWFWALSYLTHDNPITREDAGRMDKMISAWVTWGNVRGLL